MMKLSACWIVKNEAANLAASIMSVKDCAGELIVVDTGSGDDTVNIAKECGARVEYFEWVKDFSAARNFALSLASGEYVIFIDGDEYFSPPLKKADRSVIINAFVSAGADALLVPRIEVAAENKSEICAVLHGRIFRGGKIQYRHRVHEMALLKDGSIPKGAILNRYRLMHLWYGAEDDAKKLRRNIELLEAEQPELTDEFGRFNNRAYLLREYMALDEYDNAYCSLRYILDHHMQWRVICRTFLSDYIQRFYAAIRLCAIRRSRFSRKEIYDKIFTELKICYPDSREAAFADLHYQLIFDYREDKFLKSLDEIDNRLDALPPPICADGQQAEALIYARAAMAAYYRCEPEKARRFAAHAAAVMPETDGKSIEAILDENYRNAGSGIGGLILNREYQKAFDEIIVSLDGKILDQTLLGFLLIIAEKAPDSLAGTARERFEAGMALLDEATDSGDLANTGYVSGKKHNK